MVPQPGGYPKSPIQDARGLSAVICIVVVVSTHSTVGQAWGPWKLLVRGQLWVYLSPELLSRHSPHSRIYLRLMTVC